MQVEPSSSDERATEATDFSVLPSDNALALLKTDPERGLTDSEAAARLHRLGPNELAQRKPDSAWTKFLAQFTDPLVGLLLVAALISTLLWLFERGAALPYEGIAILAVVVLNAVMGFLQEARAEQAVAALRQMSAARANVIRNSNRQSIPAAGVVPGDILLVEEGDTVPADARLIHVAALQTAEAALTGESLPIAKQVDAIAAPAPLGDRINMVFSGTTVTYGRGRAVVVATGMRTQIGRVAGLITSTQEEDTPLQKELARVGRLLGIVVVAIAVLMIAMIVYVEDVSGFHALFGVVMLGVALAVAAVPEGLPAVVTAVLAMGVQRMAKRRAIVRHLTAVETLGSADVIATDKTGTLTRNEMTVRVVLTASGRVDFTGTGYAPEGEARGVGLDGALRMELERALTIADRANNAALHEDSGRWSVQGDPTEGALLVATQKAGISRNALDTRFARVAEIPFSSERKLMSTIHADAQRREHPRVFTKGAPDVLLQYCTHELVGADAQLLTEERRAQILTANEALAREALRTLGVAYGSLPPDANLETVDAGVERDLVFAGLIGMIDPPRAEAIEAVQRANRAGVRAIMLTGDHPVTASVIAAELGIPGSRAVAGAELERMTDTALDQTVREVSVYARVNPEHKLRIVRALQRSGSIVAMTGDGVNDAPALKAADIGVAMGITGTDVSKQAADIILADDNFATIVAAVEEGRVIFSNIRKFLRYLLSSNIGEVMTMFFGVLLADVIGLTAAGAGAVVLPLLATQLLWVNLVTDGVPALALGIDPAHERVMTRPPRAAAEKVITPKMWWGIVQTGVVIAVGTLLVLDASLPAGLIEGSGTLSYAQTMAFTTLVLFSLFTVFCSRSDERSAFEGLTSNKWLWIAVALSLVLQLAVIYAPFLQKAFSTVPLTATDWALCVAVGSTVLWIREGAKLIDRRNARRASKRSDPWAVQHNGVS